MGLIDKAEGTVAKHTYHVLQALGKVKIFLIVIPIICVVFGILSQQFIPERNIATCSFKIGSFATPSNPEPVLLASESQLKARLRVTAIGLRDEYPTALIIATHIDNDVITPVVNGVGPEKTVAFLKKLIEPEINLHNGRLDKLQLVQATRKESLEIQLEELGHLADSLSKAQQTSTQPIELLAIQNGLDNTRERIGKIKLELNTLSLLNASDLYIDTTQIVQEPRVVYSSKWTRPLMFGVAGLAIGLILILLIAITSIIRTIINKKIHGEDSEESSEETNIPST
jgi:hypothetical protein